MWFKPWPFYPQTLEVTKNFWKGHVFTHHPKKVTNSQNCQGLVVSWICGKKKPHDGYRSDGSRYIYLHENPWSSYGITGPAASRTPKEKPRDPSVPPRPMPRETTRVPVCYSTATKWSNEKRAGPKRLFRVFYGEKTSYPVYMGYFINPQ